MISKTTLLTCATSLFFLTACGGGAAVKSEAVTEAKPDIQPAAAKTNPDQMKSQDLNEAQLKALLIGRTQTGAKHKGKAWTNTYQADGVLKGTYGGDVDAGTYTLAGGLLCRKWSKWGKGTMSCWTVQKREKDYYATLKSGSSMSYAFIVK